MDKKKKVLFIDRDGTIIKEPPVDYQVDSLEKLEFVPYAISSLKKLSDGGFELVMATNQDGLGTDSFPEPDFEIPHGKMLTVLEGEGVRFADQLIDRSFEQEGLPTRKPGTGLFGEYLGNDQYDMAGSWVIGDRITDVMLAKNLGTGAVLLREAEEGNTLLREYGLTDDCDLVTDDWREITSFLMDDIRMATVQRKTSETDISVTVDLDGQMPSVIDTGIGFFDHMLWQIVHHSGIGLDIRVIGDLHVDEHHTVEDTAIVLGEALLQALGSKRGIERYGFALPMDESSAMVLLDFGGRIEFVWDASFQREKIGEMPTELFRHFFKSFADTARCNLHISAKGENEHHKIEGIFKAFARALRAAVRRDVFSYDLPSSKGVL